MNNALTEKKGSELTVMDMQEDANKGFEGMSTDKTAIPYIFILQSSSKFVKKGPNQIPGASDGDLFNSLSKEVYKGAIRVIPCAFRTKFTERTPGDEGEFVRTHDDRSILNGATKNPEKGNFILPNGNTLSEVAYYYVLVVNETGTYDPAIITMSSSQLKKSRNWNGQMKSLKVMGPNGAFTPAIYSHSYLLSTTIEQKGKNSWHAWTVSAPERVMDRDLVVAARKFNDELAMLPAPTPAASEDDNVF
jgi:hypothetical protein